MTLMVSKQSAGFTLLELLVALTLLSLLVLSLNGTIGLGARAWDRLGQASQNAMVRSAGLETMRLLLEQVQPVHHTRSDGVRSVSFEGGKDWIAFAADLGPASPVPGLRRYRLSNDSKLDNGVILETSGLRPSSQGTAPVTRSRTPVLSAAQMAVSYYDSETRSWHTNWRNRGKLPELIRLEIGYNQGTTSEGGDVIVVAPRAAVGWIGAARKFGGSESDNS